MLKSKLTVRSSVAPAPPARGCSGFLVSQSEDHTHHALQTKHFIRQHTQKRDAASRTQGVFEDLVL